MAYTNIEFICSGNNGRGPLAEEIAKIVLATLGRTDVTVTSSGTLVDNSDLTSLLPFVEKAVKKGILIEGSLELFKTDPERVWGAIALYEASMRTSYLRQSIGEVDHFRR